MKALLVVLLAAPLSVATSQQSDALLRQGSRLRFVTMDTVDRATGEVRFTHAEGRLESVDTRSLVLRPGIITGEHAIAQDSVRLPMTGVIRAEAFTGLKRQTVPGALVGLTAGSVLGYLVSKPGASDSQGPGQCAPTTFLFCPPTKGHDDTQVVRTLSLGAAGVVAGALVGHLIQTESWTQIDLVGLRLRFGVK